MGDVGTYLYQMGRRPVEEQGRHLRAALEREACIQRFSRALQGAIDLQDGDVTVEEDTLFICGLPIDVEHQSQSLGQMPSFLESVRQHVKKVRAVKDIALSLITTGNFDHYELIYGEKALEVKLFITEKTPLPSIFLPYHFSEEDVRERLVDKSCKRLVA